MKAPIKKKAKTKGWYEKKLDTLFSRYIRQKYADHAGYAQCYTCGYTAQWKELQNGHFIRRSNRATRWDEMNCRVQCMKCNVFRDGEMDKFAFRLARELGAAGFRKLEARGKDIARFGIGDLKEMIEAYKKYA